MSEALLRGAILELKCLRDAMVRRGPFINRTGTATDRLLCRIMVGILNNAIPALEAIQKMSSEQRVQAQALSFVLTLKSKVEHYIHSRYGPLRNSRESEPLKALMANDIERLLSALGNIVYALEKGRAPTASKTPTATTTQSALSASLNPFILWYKLCTDFFWASTSQLVPANTGPNAVQHEPKHLKGIDGGRQPNAQRTPRPGGAVLSLCR